MYKIQFAIFVVFGSLFVCVVYRRGRARRLGMQTKDAQGVLSHNSFTKSDRMPPAPPSLRTVCTRRGVPHDGSFGAPINVNQTLKKRKAKSATAAGFGQGGHGGLFGRLF